MCNEGGTFNRGTIYEWNYTSNVVTKKFDFNNVNGAFPMGGLTLYNNKFYGTTYEGGIHQTTGPNQHYWVIFEYNPTNNIFIKKKEFDLIHGYGPKGSLMLKGNVFWGTNTAGIFSWNPATNNFVYHYNLMVGSTPCEINRISVGSQCFETLFASGNYLLGSSSEFGGSLFGAIFKYYPDSNQMVSSVHMQATDGSYPKGSLTKVGNKLYGLTFQGGNSHSGNIFEWDLITQQFTERLPFDGYNTGTLPKGSLTYYNGKLYGINGFGKSYVFSWQGALAGSWLTRNPGDLFSWDPATNMYQSLATAEYAMSSLTLLNNKLFYTTELSFGSYALGGAISAYNLLTNLSSEVAALPENSGTYNIYQGYPGANGVTYYNGKFYGMTTSKFHSGADPRGTIYEWDTTTNLMAHKIDFVDSIGTYPLGNLLLVGNEFYGLTSGIGSENNGAPFSSSLFKWNPTTNILQKKAFGSSFGTPTQSGGKIYYISEGSFLRIYKYDPVLDTVINVISEPIFLFNGANNSWNYDNCTRPPSYQQLLEVIPNQDPLLSNIPTTQTICSNQVNTATFNINDADLDTMSFQISSSNASLIPVANISITNVNSVYTISYSGIANQTGTTTLSFIADDGYGGSVNFSFIVNVTAPTNLNVTQNGETLNAQQNGETYQWINCNGNMAISGEINQSFTAIANGNYAVVITNANGCSDTSACVGITIVGISESDFKNAISISPNPANDLINLKANSSMLGSTYRIIETTGRVILTGKIASENSEIDISNLSKGTYFLEILINGKRQTLKIIKQ
jgi:hypothetical protein